MQCKCFRKLHLLLANSLANIYIFIFIKYNIYRGFVNPGAGINVKMELLPFATLHTAYITIGVDCLDWVLVIMTSLCFCYAWALPLLNFGLGRNTPYSRIEMIAGMPFGALSLANFMYAMFKVILSLIPFNAVILLFNNDVPWSLFDNCESSTHKKKLLELAFYNLIFLPQTSSCISSLLWVSMSYL